MKFRDSWSTPLVLSLLENPCDVPILPIVGDASWCPGRGNQIAYIRLHLITTIVYFMSSAWMLSCPGAFPDFIDCMTSLISLESPLSAQLCNSVALAVHQSFCIFRSCLWHSDFSRLKASLWLLDCGFACMSWRVFCFLFISSVMWVSFSSTSPDSASSHIPVFPLLTYVLHLLSPFLFHRLLCH